MKFCSNCCYPEISVNLRLNDENICSSCISHQKFQQITPEQWHKKKLKLADLLEKRKKNQPYDCVIPVSGGKDSYFQTHIICKEFNLKPLLVTYNGNNFLPEGDYNRDMMRHHFDADHIVWGPSVDVLKKLNRLCFKKMGDMNWQNHCGIFTAPIRVACNFNISTIIWGEVAWDVSGMFDPNDYVEFSSRVRHEHGLRGYEWNDLINDSIEKLEERDMYWAKYPTDIEILKNETIGLYIGNFYKWDSNIHLEKMKELYSFKESEVPFERTYRRASNLDDRYENGIHDLLKFIKFGYGRATDHASKDIRDGYISREKGIEYVLKYDHVVSSDLDYWLKYVEMSEDEFWKIANSFRSEKIWWIEKNYWNKFDIDGKVRQYGEVRGMSNEEKKKYFK